MFGGYSIAKQGLSTRDEMLDQSEQINHLQLPDLPQASGGQMAGVSNGTLLVISSAELLTDSNGKVSRRYLIDGWRYLPGAAAGRLWQRIADAPRPVVAAPAIDGGASRILVFSGDDGTNAQRVFELKDNHPGFSREILAYDTGINNQGQWSKAGELPVSLVTTSAVKWRGAIVIPGGEDRPGHRSARTLVTVAH